jgi:Flp pilus assembly protein TadG
MRTLWHRQPGWATRGQTLAEVGIALPLLTFMLVATLQTGWVLYQGHVVRKTAREAVNLISRQATLDQTETVVQGMQVYPGGAFNTHAKLILTVLARGTSGLNNGQTIIIQRHSIGNVSGTSVVGNPAQGRFGPSPTYTALDQANDTTLQTGPLPNGLNVQPNQVVYVAELFTSRSDLASLGFWNIAFPTTLHANAFF